MFTVHFDGRIFKIPIKTNLTVGELKIKIQEQTGVRVCRQALRGWKESKKREAQSNSTVLRQLNLDKQNELHLTDMSREGFVHDGGVVVTTNGSGSDVVGGGMAVIPAAAALSNGQENQTFTLTITLKPSGETKVLKFPGRHTVIGVKTDVYTVTDIQVRHQRWTGWPQGVQNSTTLAESGIGLEHNFTLESSKENRNNAEGSNMNT